MAMTVSKSKLVFWGLFAVNLVISILAYYVLPERFFNDANYIVDVNLHGVEKVGSYGFTIAFYELLYLSKLPYPVVAIIQFPILFYLLSKIGIPPRFDTVTAKNLIIYLSFFMLAIFVSMPSKEFITFIFLSIIPLLYQSRWSVKSKVIVSVLLMFAFGAVFRIYFILIPIIALGMYAVSYIKFRNRVLAVFFYGIVLAIFLSFAHGVAKGRYLSDFSREHVNEDRRYSNVNSMILSPVRADVWYGEAVSIFYGFVAVNLPVIEAAKHILSPQIVAFTLWQLALFYILMVRYLRCLKDRGNRSLELWCILFLFAYFIIQGVFEPDLGTAVRHKIGFLPLIYFVFYYDHFKRDARSIA